MSKPKKKGSFCFICGTLPDIKENGKVGLFIANNKRFPLWEKVITKIGFQIGSRLCDKHFDVCDIIKGREIGGTFFKFALWKLTDTAMPKYFLGTEKAAVPLKRCHSNIKGVSKKRNPIADCFSNNNYSTPRHSKNIASPTCDALSKPENVISDMIPKSSAVELLIQSDNVEALDTNQQSSLAFIHAEYHEECSVNTTVTDILDQSLSPTDDNLNHLSIHQQEPSVNVAEVELCNQHSIADQVDQDNIAGNGNLAMDQGPLVQVAVPLVENANQHLVADRTAENGQVSTNKEPGIEVLLAKPSCSVNLKTRSSVSSPGEVDPSVRGELDFGFLTRVINIPNNWRWNTVTESCDNIFVSGTEVVYKLIMITSSLLTFFVNGKEVFFPLIKSKFWTPIDLQLAVGEFDSQSICTGILDLSLFDIRVAKKNLQSTGNMRSFKCKTFCGKDEKQCINCRIHEGKLKYVKMSQSQTVVSLRKRLKANQRRIQRFIQYRKNAAQTVENLRRSIHALSANQLSEKIKHLPHQTYRLSRT